MEEHSFGHWLRLKRKALDLTQDGLADRVGCSVAMIRKLESEERRPSAQIVERLAEIFDISPDEQAKFLRYARGDWNSAPVDLTEDLPWHVPTKSHRSSLPATTSSLVGREKELGELHEYLLTNDTRLVTLMGPPGIGKTRLSIELARQSLHDFPDGVFFVALAPFEDPSVIATTIVRTLDFTEAKNQSARQQLVDSIGENQMLIVLDNCEHLIQEVAELVSGLLSACSRLKILTTSREALRIPGEWLYTVPALEVLKESASVDLGTTSTSPALTLFAERARAVRSDFVLNKENIESVASICTQLDGLPLAIELIAARIRLMSPQTLLTKLNDQFVLYADGMRALPMRQKTLHNAIHWSYSVLPAEEQDLFLRLSVFAGGFTLEAAESIFSRTVTNKSVSDLIALLLDKSLLQRSLNERGEPRFSMLVTIQQFASNHLRERKEETEVRNWHRDYFLDLAEQADKEIHGPAQVEWMDRLEVERDNFRAALDWSVSNQQTNVALRLLNALCWTWLMRAHFNETRSWFEKVSNLPEISAYPALYARLLNFMGRMNWVLGNYREGESFLNEAHAIWLKLSTEGEQGLAQALEFLGLITYSREKDFEQAQSLLTESLSLYQKHQDQSGIAVVRHHLGLLALSRNENSLALSLLEQSMDLFKQLGDIWGKSRASKLLGELFLKNGNYEKALFFFEQNLRFDEEIKFKSGIVPALSNLGDLHRYQGDYIQAKQYYQRNLDISRTYGMKADWGLGLYFLGLTALHQNDYPAATRYFADHFKAERESLDKVSAIILVLSQAAISAGTNQSERAARLYGAAQAIFEKTDYRISPFNQAEFDRHIQLAREQLGTDKFENLANEGRAMTMEQAVAYALADQE